VTSEGEDESNDYPTSHDIHKIRRSVLMMTCTIGKVSFLSTSVTAPDSNNMNSLFRLFLQELIKLSSLLFINLEEAIARKMKLNRVKYPPSLCQGTVEKYDSYAASTGVTRHVHQTVLYEDQRDIIGTIHNKNKNFLSETHPKVMQDLKAFVIERSWDEFDTPNNLLLATIGELGELSQLVAWKGDEPPVRHLSKTTVDKICQEIADVAILSLRLADMYGFNKNQEKIIDNNDDPPSACSTK